MKKMKKYEAPETKHQEVELESGFLKGSVFVDKEDSESLSIENQKKVVEDFNFGNDTWD